MATNRLSSLPLGADHGDEVPGRDAHIARAEAARQRRANRAAAERVTEYAAVVRRVALRFAIRRFGWQSAEDIAQVTTEKFLADPVKNMAAYADPQAFAVSVARTTGIDLGRRERAQRGEGANLRAGADGQLEPARVVVSTETITELRPDADIAEIVAAGLDLQVVLDRLDPLDRCLLELRYLDDYRVGEIATALGMVSSTVSRRITAARARLTEFVVAP